MIKCLQTRKKNNPALQSVCCFCHWLSYVSKRGKECHQNPWPKRYYICWDCCVTWSWFAPVQIFFLDPFSHVKHKQTLMHMLALTSNTYKNLNVERSIFIDNIFVKVVFNVAESWLPWRLQDTNYLAFSNWVAIIAICYGPLKASWSQCNVPMMLSSVHSDKNYHSKQMGKFKSKGSSFIILSPAPIGAVLLLWLHCKYLQQRAESMTC